MDRRYDKQALKELAFVVDNFGCKGFRFDPVSTHSLPYHPQVLPLMQAASNGEVPSPDPNWERLLGASRTDGHNLHTPIMPEDLLKFKLEPGSRYDLSKVEL